MKTIKQVEIEPIFCEDDIPEIPSEYKDLKIYVSLKHNRIALNCLCGCGSFLNLPINQDGKGWQLEIDAQKRITLIGSILQHNCGSHYIITKNKANFV